MVGMRRQMTKEEKAPQGGKSIRSPVHKPHQPAQKTGQYRPEASTHLAASSNSSWLVATSSSSVTYPISASVAASRAASRARPPARATLPPPAEHK